MKTQIALILLFTYSNSIFSQEFEILDTLRFKCQYNLEYQPDSNNIQKKLNEKVLLLIGDEITKSITLKRNLLDSIGYKMLKDALIAGETFDMSQLPISHFDFQIFTNNKNNTIWVYDEVFNDRYKYKEPEQLIWTLEDERKTILNYECQKASTSFAGRDYIAWFTTEIPISKGPYLFSGLPGLIIKIYDTKNHYVFDLESISQIQQTGFITMLKTYQYLEVSKDEFKKAKRYAQENYREKMMKIMPVSEGQMELSMENAKKRNNPIELK